MMMRRTDKQEKGAAMVELAIIVPLLLMIVIAAIDLGDAWFRSSAAQSAVRSASVVSFDAGNEHDHDLRVLRSVISELENRGIENIRNVIIYDADFNKKGNGGGKGKGGNKNPVPIGCISNSYAVSGVDGLCINYGRDFLSKLFTEEVEAEFVNGDCQASIDKHWCAQERGIASNGGLVNPDGSYSIGIYVVADQPTMTGLMPGFTEYTITKNAVNKGWNND